MFTGIIEGIGRVLRIEQEGTNVHFELEAPFTSELKIDQSVAHNGVCLTVVEKQSNSFVVTAIQETLDRTNLGGWKVGDAVNLERCTSLGGRLDGHLVQGHVDATAVLENVVDANGSWVLHFVHEASPENITVQKGSITINGVSLTVVDSHPEGFSVAIIPYTWEHTNLGALTPGDRVNLEFDVIGKYVARILAQQGLRS
ncbi:MAG: riboflavin synthase [Crocinitomicaceae bacterium]|jgi:riboflavin synthase|nr:riboflavin synthase [Crocinitomicaceae bacterium]MDB4493990.1 riboflavin synthase [Flavobacteriales bacterium]